VLPTSSSSPLFRRFLEARFYAFQDTGNIWNKHSVKMVLAAFDMMAFFDNPRKGCNICSSPSDPSKRSCHSPLTLLQARRSACHKPKSNPQTSQTLALPHVRGGSDPCRQIQTPSPQTLSSIMKPVNMIDTFTPLFPSKSVEKYLIPWYNGVLARCWQALMFKKGKKLTESDFVQGMALKNSCGHWWEAFVLTWGFERVWGC